MTKLSIDIKFNSNCILSVKDTTGFNGANGFSNITGTPSDEGVYKLSDGYFINAVIYNRYNKDADYVNKDDEFEHILASQVKPNYADNFETKNYKLGSDGVYTFKRIFVISKEYYLANQGTFTKTVLYYDSDDEKFYEVIDNTPEEITLEDVVKNISGVYTGTFISYTFVSTCNLNRCLYLLQKDKLSNGIAGCKSYKHSSEIDYIYMTLNVIKYLKDDGYLTEVQRIIENNDCCNLVCNYISKKTNNDCGCG